VLIHLPSFVIGLGAALLVGAVCAWAGSAREVRRLRTRLDQEEEAFHRVCVDKAKLSHRLTGGFPL
jgi:hypothetical protein